MFEGSWITSKLQTYWKAAVPTQHDHRWWEESVCLWTSVLDLSVKICRRRLEILDRWLWTVPRGQSADQQYLPYLVREAARHRRYRRVVFVVHVFRLITFINLLFNVRKTPRNAVKSRPARLERCGEWGLSKSKAHRDFTTFQRLPTSAFEFNINYIAPV